MKEIPLTRGLVALVDDSDYEELSKYKWYADADGYAIRAPMHPTIPGKQIRLAMHRVIMGLENGDPMEVDHRDLNKANNQRGNLRIATPRQNGLNQGKPVCNTSGFKGVRMRQGKWAARIVVHRREIQLGSYATPEEAHAAYCAAADKYFGNFANHG